MSQRKSPGAIPPEIWILFMFALAVLFAGLLTLLAPGCHPPPPDDDNPPPTTTIPPEPPPRVDQPFSWDHYRGISEFALFAHTPEEITATVTSNVAHGWTHQRVCAETEFWDGAYPYLQVPRDLERLRRGLDTIARIPGAYILLISDCTLKRQVPVPVQITWAQKVAEVAAEFQNVAIEVENEMDNCRGRDDWGGQPSYCPGKQNVAEMIQLTRAAGVKEVTLDDHVCVGDPDDKLEFRFFNVNAHPADFHPCRNDPRTGAPWDPTNSFLDKLVRANRGLVILSETVAYSPGAEGGGCSGTRTCDQGRVQRMIDICVNHGGCRPTYHSSPWGLSGETPAWYPESR